MALLRRHTITLYVHLMHIQSPLQMDAGEALASRQPTLGVAKEKVFVCFFLIYVCIRLRPKLLLLPGGQMSEVSSVHIYVTCVYMLNSLSCMNHDTVGDLSPFLSTVTQWQLITEGHVIWSIQYNTHCRILVYECNGIGIYSAFFFFRCLAIHWQHWAWWQQEVL